MIPNVQLKQDPAIDSRIPSIIHIHLTCTIYIYIYINIYPLYAYVRTNAYIYIIFNLATRLAY